MSEKIKIRTRGFIKAALKTATIDERPRIGILTEALYEVLGHLGFKIIPPTHFIPEKAASELDRQG